MSIYFEQYHNISSFNSSDSWIVLSEIEQQIKAKIEAIGTPLKDWDINIYRGILTGYNEAFIIDGNKKDELIASDPKSAEIIRPLLRGRDIKRYSYEFADLYIITTFPSLKINIENYPAVKEHLMSFGYDRLKQTGDKGSRKKTNNQWFETQDTIAYWEDFFRPKIIFQEMVQEPSFIIDNEGIYMCLDTARIMTGEDLDVLLTVMNSKLFFYAVKTFYGGGGLGETGVRMKHTFFENFPVPIFSEKTKESLKKSISNFDNDKLIYVDKIIYDSYGFTDEEIQFIGAQ